MSTDIYCLFLQINDPLNPSVHRFYSKEASYLKSNAVNRNFVRTTGKKASPVSENHLHSAEMLQ